MNWLPKVRFGRLAMFGACLATLGAVPFQGEVDKATKDDVVQSVERTLETNAFVPGADFTKVDGYLSAEKDSIDKASTEDAFRTAVSAALEKLGYSHIVLFTPTMVQQRRNSAAVGIGIMAQYKDQTLLVRAVFPDTPAAEVGIEPGDVITEIDGKKPAYLGSLAGEEGQKVTIRFTRFEGGQKEATLVRRKFSTVIPPTLTWIDKNTAVLKIPTFDLSYDRDKVESLVEQAHLAKNLVLDLRNNGGGTVVSMCHLLGFFMPSDKTIGTFISKRVVQQYIEETHGDASNLAKIAAWAPRKLKPQKDKLDPYTGNLAVLINGGSGSASEIATEALKETLDVPIVGEKSAGKVLVSVMAQLPHGYQLQYPITDYVSAQGIRLENEGITPDVEAKDPRIKKDGTPDEPLDKAVALLHRAQLREERFGATH